MDLGFRVDVFEPRFEGETCWVVIALAPEMIIIHDNAESQVIFFNSLLAAFAFGSACGGIAG